MIGYVARGTTSPSLGIGDQLDQVVGVGIQTLHDVEHGVAVEVTGALLGEDDQAGKSGAGLVLSLRRPRPLELGFHILRIKCTIFSTIWLKYGQGCDLVVHNPGLRPHGKPLYLCKLKSLPRV